MNYELAKKLKDAGFPQNFEPPFDFYYPVEEENEDSVQHCSGQEVDSGCYGLGVSDGKIEDWSFGHKYDEKSVKVLIKVPTLSELIEACGDGFGNLIRGDVKNWFATDFRENNLKGPTPEEAVAMLYLSLHENKVIKPNE